MSRDDPPLVDLQCEAHTYPDGTVGMHDVDFSVYPDEVVALVGGNGAGKSTLLEHLNATLVPDDGELVVDGEPFDTEAFPAKSLAVVAPAGTEVDISASGRIEAVDTNLTRHGPRRVSGRITGRTEFEYAGELTYLEPAGEVQVFENGRRVEPEDVLPSSLPGEVRITGAESEVTVQTSDKVRVRDGPGASADDGAITGRPTSGTVVGRYDGNVEGVEHENGATVEVREESKRLVCTAPEDASADFAVEATDGVVLDRESHSRAQVTVASGESQAIKYYGTPSLAVIDGTAVSFDADKHKDAIASAKLQRAAAFERTDAYRAVEAETDSRIRHNAQGIRTTAVMGESPRDMVFFQFTDVVGGDYGAAHFGRLRESETVLSANFEIQRLGADGNPTDIIVYELEDPNGGTKFDVSTFEVGSRKRSEPADGPEVNVFDGKEERLSTQSFSIPDWLPDIPSPGELLDAFGDTLSDFASDIAGLTKETTSEIISGGLENASNTTIDDIAIKTGTLIVDTQEGLIELVAEAQGKLPKKTLSKLLLTFKPGFAGTLTTIGQSGAFQEIADNNLGCGGCLASIAILLSVGLEATAAGTCYLLSIAPIPIAGGVACTLFVGAILEYGATFAAPDAREVCGDGTPVEVDVC